MINTDFPTTYAKNYILDVVYSINYASKVGRIAKPFADTKFSTAFLNEKQQDISLIFSGWDELPQRLYKLLEKYIAFL